jgi:hypothetical protein
MNSHPASTMLLDGLAGAERDRQLTVTGTGLESLESAQKLWENAQAGLKKHIGENGFDSLMTTLAELERL